MFNSKTQSAFQISVDEKIENQQQTQQETITTPSRMRHFGNMIPIMVNAQTLQPKYLLGPHFYLFIPTWFISIGLMIFIITKIIDYSNPVLMTISIVLGSIFLYLYAKIGFSLPGVASCVTQPDLGMRSNPRYCVPCRIVRPKGTEHCYYCDVCIHNMDHHCPWIGKCVGRDNLCLFYQFLISVTFLMISLILTAVFTSQKFQNV